MQNLIWMLPLGVFPFVLLAGLISIVIAAFRFRVLPRLMGRLGETLVNIVARRQLHASLSRNAIDAALDSTTYHLIPDIMLPTPDGTTQIDHVIVSRYGIFVVETKTYKGWIYGDERDAQWTQAIFKRKERFQNPLRQNYKHTKTLADLTGIPENYFKSLVVFVGEAEFKTDMPANVVYVRDFVGHIKSHETPIIKDEQVPEIVSAIQEWAGTVTDEQKARHVAHVRQNKAPVNTDAKAPACPWCGAAMALRTSRKDGSRFWGCSKFPACRGTRQA